MMNRTPAPVLIERTLLLSGDQPDPGVVERLVSFQRHGNRLLLIAPRPKRWRPTRKAVDRDLAMQQRLHQLFTRAGAELDGVFYLAARLFSRRSAMEREMEDIAQRYDRNIFEITMIGSDPALLEAYMKAGGPAQSIGSRQVSECPCFPTLDRALQQLNGQTG